MAKQATKKASTKAPRKALPKQPKFKPPTPAEIKHACDEIQNEQGSDDDRDCADNFEAGFRAGKEFALCWVMRGLNDISADFTWEDYWQDPDERE